ncbi:MAG: phage holin family protein [Elusimicrobia bacterium]|nr:phage holin family protein [Elusimicrobiota bacterium]
MSRAQMIYFIAYFITNLLAVVIASKIVNDLHYDTIKLLFFSIIITVFQFTLEHFFKLNIILTIFVYPIIYMFAIYIVAKITKLLRVDGFGAAIKAALMMVFLQICMNLAFEWKLADYFHI